MWKAITASTWPPRRLAYEYDLPLWNWWKAAQALPNRGLDPDRPDGFHISLESWDERSFTALQAIDSVWRGVTVVQPAATATQPAEPSQQPIVRAYAVLLSPRVRIAQVSNGFRCIHGDRNAMNHRVTPPVMNLASPR